MVTAKFSQACEELMLMARVARKYYVGGLSKSEIADQLFLSRFKVARLLEGAKEAGIVRFEIGLPGDGDLSVARELKAAFELRHAVVIDDGDDDQQRLFRRLGEATASLLAEVIHEDDAVGIASTRTLMGLENLSEPIKRCTFVQLTGQLPRLDAADVISGIRSLTRKAEGSARVFYAPMIAASEEARRSYLAQADVASAFELFPNLNVFVTGVGEWREGMSVTYDNLPDEVRSQAAKMGAVAEIVGVPLDRHGNSVDGLARRRVVAPEIESVRSARDRIGVIFDPEKAKAAHIVAKSGLLNSIVTHRAVAEALLAL